MEGASGSVDWPAVLATLLAGEDLAPGVAAATLSSILDGSAGDVRIAAFLTALRIKGASIGELAEMVEVMIASATPIELPDGAEPIDIVGTGGTSMGRAHALNVSTMASFVVAGAGARVVKHGNRRASSTSGSFDLLEQLGVAIELDGAAVAQCVHSVGLGFCFARAFHPAMRHAGPVRSLLGFPTVFNILGPLSHPAGVLRQVIGVADPELAPQVMGVLHHRNAPRAMVVIGDDGMDEITTTGPTTIYELREGEVTRHRVEPSDLGLARVTPEAVAGGDARENERILRAMLDGEKGPYRDIVSINAAAGLVVAGMVDDLAEGLDLAHRSLDSGAAQETLERLVVVSNAAASGEVSNS